MPSLEPWAIRLIDTLAGVVVGTLLGMLAGWWNATRLQDRERRIRLSATAKALLAEVRRIQAELGEPPSDHSFPVGSQAVIPKVSDWFNSVLVQAADADMRIVEHFMVLERELHNLNAQEESLKELVAHKEWLKGTLDNLELSEAAIKEENPEGTGWENIALRRVEQQNKIDHMQGVIVTAGHMRNAVHRRVMREIEQLEGVLHPLRDGKPVPRNGNGN